MATTEAFYEPAGEGAYMATAYTIGPWDERAQHGGPPSALIVGAIERAARQQNPALSVVRATLDFLRPVVVGRVELRLTPVRQGRRVAEWTGEIVADGKSCLRAAVLLIASLELPTERSPAAAALPPVTAKTSFEFPFFRWPVAYHSAVEVRWAVGQWGAPPCGAWMRSRVPLVLGQATLPIEKTLIVADAANGVGAALPFDRFTFVNADLTVSMSRPLEGDWVGLLVTTTTPPHGIGQTHAQIEDATGPCGVGLQSLVIAPRDG